MKAHLGRIYIRSEYLWLKQCETDKHETFYIPNTVRELKMPTPIIGEARLVKAVRIIFVIIVCKLMNRIYNICNSQHLFAL